MVNFNEIYHFSRFQRGSNIFRRGGGGPTFSSGGGGGVVQLRISLETHKTCDFPGGPDPLSPPSGSALECAIREAQTSLRSLVRALGSCLNIHMNCLSLK